MDPSKPSEQLSLPIDMEVARETSDMNVNRYIEPPQSVWSPLRQNNFFDHK